MTDDKLDTCGCCEGEDRLTPVDTYNRPGLDTLVFRAGTHAAFFETMIADLARKEIVLETIDSDGGQVENRFRPLRDLKTRSRDDFSIALLDAWATIADVLTFYQERIANEGYLRTATERRSILELARLVGYELAPGVAASTFLSFVVDETEGVATLPKGTRAQSIPEPGETMQSFETMRDLEARYEYNELKMRLAQPQFLAKPPEDQPLPADTLYLPGQRNDLRPSDRILMAFGTADDQGEFKLDGQATYWLAQVQDATLLDQPARTAVSLQPEAAPITNPRSEMLILDGLEQAYMQPKQWYLKESWSDVIDAVVSDGALPSQPPESVVADAANQDVGFQGAAALSTQFAENIYTVLGQEVAPLDDVKNALRAVVLLPLQVSLYGHDAPWKGLTKETANGSREFETILSEWPAPAELVELLSELQRLIQGLGDWASKLPEPPEGLKEQISVLSGLARELAQQQDYIDEWNRLFSSTEVEATITLDRVCEEIGLNSLVVLAWREPNAEGEEEHRHALFQVTGMHVVSTSLFNVAATATRLELQKIKGHAWNPANMAIIRSTMVHAASEFVRNPVPYRILAEVPLRDTHVVQEEEDWTHLAERYGVSEQVLKAANAADPDNGLQPGQTIVIPLGRELELDGIYKDLKPGRWLAITGMRTDIPVVGQEVALIEAVEHRFTRLDEETDLPGDLRHTFVTLTAPLSLPYQRAAVTISANVVPATHGETARGVPPRERDVILGSGDGAQAHQRFELKLPPGKRLTYLSAPTRDGVASTLQVYINDVIWHWEQTLLSAGPTDRVYTVQTDDDGQTVVITGDGIEGARPPTGRENVWARYRVGIGKAGNVKAGQISLLATRPPGVKEVSNWVPATGGTDPESRDQARDSVKFSVRTLDRLVGLQDYEDFARTFAGIGKAKAEDGTGTVTVYVAGQDNIPLEGSEVVANLKKALEMHDGSDVQIDVIPFTPRLISLVATVHISSDRLWEKVQPAIRLALQKRFGFARRELGQAVAWSEIVKTMQDVPGVTHVQITRLAALTWEQLKDQAIDSPTNGTGEAVATAIDGQEEDEKPWIEKVELRELAFIDSTVPSLIVLKEPDAQTEGE